MNEWNGMEWMMEWMMDDGMDGMEWNEWMNDE